MILRRILAAVTVACLFAGPALAQKTKAQLTTEIGTTYPDNTVGSITPSGVRTYETDVINSIMPTAPVVSGNLACFNGTTGLLQDCGAAPATVPLTIGTTPIDSAVNGEVIYANGSVLGQYTNTQLTSLIQTATAINSGAIPAWPNSTTTFFRGDGSYATLNFAALGGQSTLAQFPTGVSDTALGYWGSTAASALAINNCTNALTYSTSTHAFGCNTLAGTGTVTSVGTAGLATGGPITSSGTVTVTGAAASDERTGTSTTVATTPGVERFAPSAIKAWFRLNTTCTTGTCTLASSYNVTSVAHNATGDYTVTFTNAFADSNYIPSCVGQSAGANSNAQAVTTFASATNQTSALSTNSTTAVRILTANGSTGTLVDQANWGCMVVGNQ